MSRWTVLLITLIASLSVALGCSSGGDSVTPTSGPELTASDSSHSSQSNMYLWGYYDVTIDPDTQSITAVPNRTTMFAANVVDFLNGNPAAMKFTMVHLVVGTDVITVDINVKLSHPFDGMPQFNGYDVKGVFIGDSGDALKYDSSYKYPVYGTNQFMLDDPLNDDGGGPDGYSRWFNAKEFTTPGLFGYTEGNYATKGFAPSSTLNPYRYYADGITIGDVPFDFLVANYADNAIFASGSSNTRNYYLEFPLPLPGATYGYAVVASWEDPAIHPANAPESPAISVTVTPDIYYVDDTNNGGDLILDIDIFSWEDQPTDIFIETDLKYTFYTFNATDLIPVGGTEQYSTYHVEIPTDNVQGNSNDDGDGEFWVICEAGGYDYKCGGLIPTGPSDTLASFFRYDLFINDESYCNDWTPVVDTMNGETQFVALTQAYTDWTIEGDFFEAGDIGVAVNDGDSDLAVATNVTYVDQNNLMFDIDLSSVDAGVYDIVVTNGCGDQLTGIGVDMIAVLYLIDVTGDPNIDVIGSRGTPKDLSCQPNAAVTTINYDTSSNYSRFYIWNNDYTSTNYGPCSAFGGYAMSKFDGYNAGMFCGVEYQNSSNNYVVWTSPRWTCSYSGATWFGSSTMKGMKDVANHQAGNFVLGVYDRTSNMAFFRVVSVGSYSYSMRGAPWFGGSGTDGVIMNNLKGIDVAAAATYAQWYTYFLEDIPASNTGSVELWNMNPSAPSLIDSFGVDFLCDPIDITVDSNGNVYVLEENSDGDGVIWAWDDNGNLVGTSLPFDPGDVSGVPIALECDNYADPDEVHLLHDDGITMFVM